MAKALIVEDEIALRMICLRTLRSLGYQVSCVGDGDEALGHLTQADDTPELLLMSVMLPDDSGGRLLDYLAQHDTQTPPPYVILMSSNVAHKQLVEVPHWVFIRKPVLPRQLISVVNRFEIPDSPW